MTTKSEVALDIKRYLSRPTEVVNIVRNKKTGEM